VSDWRKAVNRPEPFAVMVRKLFRHDLGARLDNFVLFKLP
jgi:hypothetical protein